MGWGTRYPENLVTSTRPHCGERRLLLVPVRDPVRSPPVVYCLISVQYRELGKLPSHSGTREEGMLHLGFLAPDTLRFQTPIEFLPQPSDLGPADASGHSPRILSPSVTYSGRQLPGEGGTQETVSHLVTYPWRSHAEVIMSIDLAISNISQRASPTITDRTASPRELGGIIGATD